MKSEIFLSDWIFQRLEDLRSWFLSRCITILISQLNSAISLGKLSIQFVFFLTLSVWLFRIIKKNITHWSSLWSFQKTCLWQTSPINRCFVQPRTQGVLECIQSTIIRNRIHTSSDLFSYSFSKSKLLTKLVINSELSDKKLNRSKHGLLINIWLLLGYIKRTSFKP